MQSWKSTVSGILSFVMATAGVLTSFAAAQMIVDPSRSKVWVIVTAGCTLASSLGKTWIGLITKDADKVTSADVVKANIAATSQAAGKTTVPLLLIGVSLIALGVTGCSGWERTSYQTLASSKAVIDQAHLDYEGRIFPRTQAAHDLILEAENAQKLAVDAMETYETIKATNGSAGALSTQQQIVDALLLKLPTFVADVRRLYANGSAPTPSKVVPAVPSAAPPLSKPIAFLRPNYN